MDRSYGRSYGRLGMGIRGGMAVVASRLLIHAHPGLMAAALGMCFIAGSVLVVPSPGEAAPCVPGTDPTYAALGSTACMIDDEASSKLVRDAGLGVIQGGTGSDGAE